MKVFVWLLVTVILASTTAASIYRLPLSTFLGSNRLTRIKRQGRIVGGTAAKEGEFPWLVSLQRNGFFGRSHFCAGSIADNKTILTAAHCIEELQAIGVWVVAGEYRLDAVSGFEQELRASQLMLHERYDPYYLKRDIGIIKLNGALVFNFYVKPVKLPGRNFLTQPDTSVVVAGWGTTQEGGSLSNVLLKATIPAVSDQDCRTIYGTELIDDSMLCAGFTSGGHDSCQGDSGGQLMLKDEILVGIVSWGQGCGQPDYPGVYTEVSAYIDWITNRMAAS